MTLPTYDRAFFDSHAAGTAASADRIVPLLVDWFRPASVLDVGCAQGAWLKAFADRDRWPRVGAAAHAHTAPLVDPDPGRTLLNTLIEAAG
jgi:hypothetical protein